MDTLEYYNVDDEDEYLEVPSCIDSLVNSAEQLQLLARQLGQYYIKLLLCYGYTAEQNFHNSNQPEESANVQNKSRSKSKGKISLKGGDQEQDHEINRLVSDTKVLESSNSVLKVLPLLNELSLFVERCFVTIESALKRSTYYLNKSANNSKTDNSSNDDFFLSSDTRLDSIFIALMDLIYALVSLGKTLSYHTNIGRDLKTFISTCKLLIEPRDIKINKDEELENIPREKLQKLVSHINNINLTLCIENSSLFQQCLEHFQHFDLILSADKTKRGFKDIGERLQDFMIFYGENLIMSRDGKGTNSHSNNLKLARTLSTCLVDSNIIPSVYLNSPTLRLFGLTSLFAFYSSLFKKSDKRVTRVINKTIFKVKPNNILFLVGSNCFILFDEFLTKYMPKSSIDVKIIEQLRGQMSTSLLVDTSKEFERLSMKVIPWLVKLKSEAHLHTTGLAIDWPRKQIHVIDQGLKLAEEVSTSIRTILATYLHHNKPMTKNSLIPVFRLVALLKSIELQLKRQEIFVQTFSIKIMHLIRTNWRKLLSSVQKRLVSSKYSERKLNMKSILILSSICSKPELISTTYSRILLSICLSMLIPSFDLSEINNINNLIDLPRPDIYDLLYSYTDFGYLYWHIPTFGAYYNHAFEEYPGSVSELHYFHSALNDIPNLFNVSNKLTWNRAESHSWLYEKREDFLKRLNDELIEQFKSDFLDKICQEFEVELRLQTHRDLYDDGQNPFKRHIYNFKQIFRSQRFSSTFKIFNQSISMCYYVENHISKVCYNLTSIAPHDWFTYHSMINLARHRYHLQFVNSQLPAQTLDSGLDLLDIIRNLALFASRYGYDLTNQMFIEKCSSRSSGASLVGGGGGSMLSSYASSSSNQSLNVVQIQHVAKSIQTHGYGVLDSTVNCTYQTLKRLINLFSRQLSDDKLRANLQKEFQQINANATKQSSQFSITLSKANQMARKFRLSAANLNDSTNNRQIGIDLDSIRQTITQLGNLLAFIRLLKSGALNCASKSVDYIPDLDSLSLLRLSKYVDSEFGDYESTCSLKQATENLDQCLVDFNEHFSPKTNYLNIIVKLFSNLLSNSVPPITKKEPNDKVAITAVQQEGSQDLSGSSGRAEEQKQASDRQEHHQPEANKLDHLRLFFLVVPALTINYIDHLINCKERVSSRSSTARFGALISDDGFAVGVAFLLTVLGQTGDYAKLEWFKQVALKLEEDKNEVEKRLKDSSYEESLRHTSSMTLRRLNRLQSENAGLDYTLKSALLLFRSSILNT